MKKTDIAYTAGIIDGEGCITIYKYRPKINPTKIRLCLAVRVRSTDEWLCQWLKFNWGGVIAFYSYKNRPKWSDYWDWVIQANQAAIFLKAILPYLNLKRPQAELAITFQNLKHRYNHRRGRVVYKTEEELAIEEAKYILMKNLKHRGKSRQGEVLS